ncbi:GNAT family N-acetyltransferase [Thermosynechococcus sp. HN-54]|uniref:GNAT family N-acetyltransferase n=1 Tax=Thermosynechococcus sp. HN-54 TaxID=2933959 RepID=UPI00202CF256|nr:GNAT family N-acetyltransferase [Thermosynechococcus sp. HN-54]URR35695.1 GNAT family N-acetyltransferase [Thermosynechococcus sp. HN-54]
MSLSFAIRAATPADVPTIFQLIQALAAYEKLSHALSGTEEALRQHLFGDRPYAEVLLAHTPSDVIGYALFFTTYSTFLTRPGLWLEDLFVLPAYRRQGVGTALLKALAQLASDRDYGRIEWSVLDWNTTAIQFYERIGATVLPDWRICRLNGEPLQRLASSKKAE